MKKELLLMGMIGVLATSTAMAAPVTDFNNGTKSVEVNYHLNNDYDNSYGCNGDVKNAINDFGITYGLSDKIALQYNYYAPKTKVYKSTGGAFSIDEMKQQEFNILYKMNKDVNFFVGLNSYKVNSSGSDSDTSYYFYDNLIGKRENKLQVGVIGKKEFDKKTAVYGIIGLSSDYSKFKVGLSREVAPNISLDINYQQVKYNNLTDSSYYQNDTGSITTASNEAIGDVKVKGLGVGLTYNF